MQKTKLYFLKCSFYISNTNAVDAEQVPCFYPLIERQLKGKLLLNLAMERRSQYNIFRL